MIEFSDTIMKEGYGNFVSVSEIFKKEGSTEWMIESDCMVRNEILSCFYILHLYNTGEVKIIETSHPLGIDVPDDDIRELSEWCSKNGWLKLTVHSNLVEDSKDFQFWMRQYRSGNVSGELFENYEAAEHERFLMEGDLEKTEEGEQ